MFSTKMAEAEELYNKGDLAGAEAVCSMILSGDSTHLQALNVSGLIHAARKNYDKAFEVFQAACALHPDNAALHANLGHLYLLRQKPIEGSQFLMRAVLLSPETANYKAMFGQSVKMTVRTAFNPEFKKALLICLEDDHISHHDFALSWISLLGLDPSFEAFNNARKYCHDYETFRDSVSIDDLKLCLNDRFFQLGLIRLNIYAWDIECVLTWMRRLVLERGLYTDGTLLPFLCALGIHCFQNEYVFLVDEAEERKVDALAKAADLPGAFAMVSCYRPLLDFADAVAPVAAGCENDLFRSLVRVQIDEPLEERRIIKTIPALKAPVDEVSRAVQKMYEENPFPRWVHIRAFDVPENVREMARGRTILIAGCGTGHEAANVARYFPLARITAIDLSRASLAYAIRKCREAGIDNVDFMHADILDLDEMKQTFDFVLSSGVLHHMKDPVAGMRKVMARAKPGGVLKFGLYSKTARRNLKLCQDWIREQGMPATPQGIRRFRKELAALDAHDPRKQAMAMRDFYTMSQCRDLVFHVQEHTFTLPQLKQIFADIGLSVFRVALENAAVIRNEYIKMFPNPKIMDEMDRWHQFEQAYPDTFLAPYNMYLARTGAACEMDWIVAALKGA